MEHPRIGVTRWEDVLGEVIERYWARVREAGGEVVDLDEAAAGRAAELAPSLDALILTGGADVDPARYGAERHPKVKQTYPERDAMELAFLDDALRRDIPVLAICRGHQVLNVGFGGSLLQHIDSGEHRADYRTEGYPSRWHDVRIDDGCRLRDVIGAGRFESNSRHHQAVLPEGLGSGLRAVAWAPDGDREFVEGMESERHRWVVGVQWHPERLEEHHPAFAPLMRPLFEAFVREAAKVRS
ncbi:MAG: gamma-glutamyl-gamma-aminobutyrate hydrolase family protein [Dehalococcoidia bacterium]